MEKRQPAERYRRDAEANSRRQAGAIAPLGVVVMGVTASGKSLLGEALATTLGWRFIEGDRLHPPENIARMAAGLPLTDELREGWLDSIGTAIADVRQRDEGVVVACSALKRAYRDRLRAFDPSLALVYLRISPDAARDRVQRRKGHFMPASLVDSQFADLMPPDRDEIALSLDAGRPVDELVRDATAFLRRIP